MRSLLLARDVDDASAAGASGHIMRIGEEVVVEHVALARGPQQKIALIFEIGDLDLLLQIIFAVGDDEAALADQPHQQAHRAGAAAEAERKYLIALFVIAAGEGVEVPDIAPDANPERAAEKRERLEILGSHALVIEHDLPPQSGRRHRVDVERLIEPPDVGLEKLRRAVSGAVGQQHDVLRHTPSPRLVPKARVLNSLAFGCYTHELYQVSTIFRKGE